MPLSSVPAEIPAIPVIMTGSMLRLWITESSAYARSSRHPVSIQMGEVFHGKTLFFQGKQEGCCLQAGGRLQEEYPLWQKYCLRHPGKFASTGRTALIWHKTLPGTVLKSSFCTSVPFFARVFFLIYLLTTDYINSSSPAFYAWWGRRPPRSCAILPGHLRR